MGRSAITQYDRFSLSTGSASASRRSFVRHLLGLGLGSMMAPTLFAAPSPPEVHPADPLDFEELQSLARAVSAAQRVVELDRVIGADPRFRNRLEAPRSVGRHGVIFATPVAAALLCRAFGWSRPCGVAVDVHQQSWEIEVWRKDLVDPYGRRISAGTPRLGRWAVEARLTKRPGGPLPGVSAGASPAYDLLTAAADVAELEIRAWDDDIDR